MPVTVSPTGAITEPRPEIAWEESPGAITYRLIVDRTDPAENVIDAIVGVSACESGVCTYRPESGLALGSYHFKVSASAGGTSAYSPWRAFKIIVLIYFPFIRR